MSSESPQNDVEKTKGVKKRIRNFTAEERAAHRIIEKQRRDALNESFLDLARLIPALAPCRRLSKSLIVHESVQYLQSQREAWITAAEEIQALLAENLEVVAEINTWRELHGLSPKQARPASTTLQTLLKVDQDVLGTFPGGFGDNAVEETKNVDTVPSNSREQQKPQASEAETMQVDLPPNIPAQMQEVVSPVHIPDVGLQRPSLSHLSSHQSQGLVQNNMIPINHLENAEYMNTQMMIPQDLNLILPYDDSFGIAPILDENLQPFPAFSMHQNSMYSNVGLSSSGNGYYMPPATDARYFDSRQEPHTQQS